MFFMARATEPTLPGLLGRSRTTDVREKGPPGKSDMDARISRWLEVAVPLPLRQALTYRLPAGLPGCDRPGARALVPVGRRLVTGIIVGEPSGPPGGGVELKDVVELPDAQPVLPPDLLSLARWATRYYVSPAGGMVQAALPAGIGRRSDLVVRRIGPAPPGFDPGDAGRRVLEALASREERPLKALRVARSALRRLEEAGVVAVERALAPPRVAERYRTVVYLAAPDPGTWPSGLSRAPRQKAVLEAAAAAGAQGVPMEELQDRLGPSAAAVKALAGKGLVRLGRREHQRSPLVLPALEGQGTRRVPTPHQQTALEAIGASLRADAPGGFLLMGVTGSGKTEVYLQAIEMCLARGRGALYLVPEIALTPLLARQLRARLGSRLAILHSSLGPGERYDEWRRARRGEARVVLGARSAVLAPVEKPGLIVVDEEQDGSYKQEEDPRYNARDLALVRAREAAGVALLGSATPSVETWWSALQRRLTLLRLPERIHARPMARVRVIDMREEFARRRREEVVSAPLREAVADRLARGEQAIILLNRRGFAPYVQCRSCGASEGCRRCSVSLTWHRGAGRLRCHYCGYQRGLPEECSSCGAAALALTGAGTERLEADFREIFPQARLARLDRDTARGRRAPAEILSAFERGEFNLLVGTQMVAKGHDFPGVTLVGVIGADASLNLPDFRAAERTFQLLTQVAGRSGRGEEPGEVLVQAWHQQHYAIEAAVKQDFESFFEKETRFRRVMKYPPFTAMANLMVQASTHEEGVRRSHRVAEAVRAAGGDGLTVLGPAVAPLARLKDRYRFQVLVKCASRRRLSDALNEAVDALAAAGLAAPRDLVVDMDPVALL
jgi:primosomal protein N' (replication factor Y)